MQVIGEDLADRDVLVGDASYSSSWVFDRVVLTRAGRRVLAPRGSGMLGWGLPAGMGAALACPDVRTTVVTGDGALQYSLCELETAARAELDLTVVLLDNGVYGSQRLSNLLGQGKDYEDLRFGAQTDYLALARSMGWEAVRVEDLATFRDAYRLSAERGGGWLLDVAVHPDSRPPLAKFTTPKRPALTQCRRGEPPLRRTNAVGWARGCSYGCRVLQTRPAGATRPQAVATSGSHGRPALLREGPEREKPPRLRGLRGSG